METKKINLRKKLSEEEINLIKENLYNYIFENTTLDGEKGIYVRNYDYDFNDLQKILDKYKKITGADYEYLKKISEIWVYYINKDNKYIKDFMFDIFYNAYTTFINEVIYTVFNL